MLEARLQQGQLLKKLIEALKDLVQEGNFEWTASGMHFQGLDTAHVSLIDVIIRHDGFEFFRCDRNMTLGINLTQLSKVMKCSSNDDAITLKAEESAETLVLVFDSVGNARVSEFEMKLMDIEQSQLQIPDLEYHAVVKMPSSEFQRICRDLAAIGDSVTISASKEGVKFSTKGDIGNGQITLRQNAAVDEATNAVTIEMQEPVTLTFALRYLNFFAKAASVADKVSLSLTNGSPIVVEYQVEDKGHIRYFLAPKIDDEDEGGGNVANAETGTMAGVGGGDDE